MPEPEQLAPMPEPVIALEPERPTEVAHAAEATLPEQPESSSPAEGAGVQEVADQGEVLMEPDDVAAVVEAAAYPEATASDDLKLDDAVVDEPPAHFEPLPSDAQQAADVTASFSSVAPSVPDGQFATAGADAVPAYGAVTAPEVVATGGAPAASSDAPAATLIPEGVVAPVAPSIPVAPEAPVVLTAQPTDEEMARYRAEAYVGRAGGLATAPGSSRTFENALAEGSQFVSNLAVNTGVALTPLKQAWLDLWRSPAKLKTSLKLALAQFLPGAGLLMLDGAVYSWAKECALGRVRGLPEKIVRPGVLDDGLCAYGATLVGDAVLALACAVICLVLDAVKVPFAVSVILMVALAVVAAPLIQAMGLRAAVCGSVRCGLRVGEAARLVFRGGRPAKFLGAASVPLLAMALIDVALALLMLLVLGLIVGLSMKFMMAISVFTLLSLTFNAGLPAVLVMAAFMFVMFFCQVVASLVAARACAYLSAEFDPQSWAAPQASDDRSIEEE